MRLQVIANRLRQIARNPKPPAFRTASSLISVASADGLVLPKRPIEQLVAHRLTINDVVSAVGGKIDQEAIARGVPLPLVSLILWKMTEIGQILSNGVSGESVNLKQFQVEPEKGSLVPPDMVAFAAPIGARFTSPVTFGAALIRINGPRITIPLDGLHCKNMIFENCTLLYSGKTLKLENSGFSNSTFQFGENLACQRLAESILENPSVTVAIP